MKWGWNAGIFNHLPFLSAGRYARTRMYVSEDTIQTVGLIFLGSFAIGSIPFGVILAKLFRLPDPRKIGSGNIGATNMLRTGNKRVALLTLLLDAAKGFVPTYFAQYAISCCFGGCEATQFLFCALALTGSMAGHCYTPWLLWKGGKGVATALGGVLALGYIALTAFFPHHGIGAVYPTGVFIPILFCGMWLVFFYSTRYVSLASIIALATLPLFPIYCYLIAKNSDGWLFSIVALMIASAIGIWKHRANIARLRARTEPKMGRKHAA